MTVAELIAELQKLPQDKRVVAETDCGIYDIAIDHYQNRKYPEETYILFYPKKDE